MIVLIALLGLCFGSFITCISYRLPRGEDIVRKPSHCTACGACLRMWELVPVLSWLAAGGKCRHCRARIHWRYPVIELMTATLFIMIYFAYGLTLQATLLMALAVLLLILIAVDLAHYIIPDSLQLAFVPLALMYRHIIAQAPWSEILTGGALGLGLGLLLHYGYRYIRHKEGLGFGDVKLLGVIGLWLDGWTLVPFCFFAGLFGILTGLVLRRQRFPFGPALAAALFLCVAFPALPAAFWQAQARLYAR